MMINIDSIRQQYEYNEYNEYDDNYYLLVQYFLHEQGEIILCKLKENNCFDLETDEGIDLFFSKIDEYFDEVIHLFDVDAFLEDNPHIMDYYTKDDFIETLTSEGESSKSIDQQLNFFFNVPKKPSLFYLLDYLDPSKAPKSGHSITVTKGTPTYNRKLDEIRKNFIHRVSSNIEVPTVSKTGLKTTVFNKEFDSNIFLENTLVELETFVDSADLFQPQKYKDFYISLLNDFIVWLRQAPPLNNILYIQDFNSIVLNNIFSDVLFLRKISTKIQIDPTLFKLDNWWYLTLYFVSKDLSKYKNLNDIFISKKFLFLDKNLNDLYLDSQNSIKQFAIKDKI